MIPLGNCVEPLIIPLGTFVKSVYEETPLPPAASEADVNIPPPTLSMPNEPVPLPLISPLEVTAVNR